MGHYSYLRIGTATALLCRDTYYRDLAALFFESDRYQGGNTADDEDAAGPYGYKTSIRAMSQRLEMQGITVSGALADLAGSLRKWTEEQSNTEPRDQEPVPPDTEHVEREIRFSLSVDFDTLPYDEAERAVNARTLVDHLHWYMDTRSLVRLLLDWAPDQNATIALDMSELTGCCVELDPTEPYADRARAEQLAVATTNLPLIVITEGSSDARLLTEGMKVTHPHLVGFIRFFDYGAGVRPRGGADALVDQFKAFVAAGVGNRFVAVADNDAAAHEKLLGLKKGRWPSSCRLLHYPELPLLQQYPALEDGAVLPVPTDINGLAGSLEMYLGADVLTDGDGKLMPIRWKAVEPKTGLRQGSLSKADKRTVQRNFDAKLKAARAGQVPESADWSGIKAIIDSIVLAFN